MIEISKAVIQKNKKFLLLKRATHSKSYPNLWDFASGKHNSNETPEKSVTRETKEKTDFDINPGPEIKTVRYQDKYFDLLFHFFIPSITSCEIKISKDHSEYKCVTKEEINFLKLHPSVKEYFK